MTRILFADDADRLRELETAMYAAEDAHKAACIEYRRANHSRSRNRLRILLIATERCEAACDAASKAREAYAAAHKTAEQRMAQAIKAARARDAGLGVQLALDL